MCLVTWPCDGLDSVYPAHSRCPQGLSLAPSSDAEKKKQLKMDEWVSKPHNQKRVLWVKESSMIWSQDIKFIRTVYTYICERDVYQQELITFCTYVRPYLSTLEEWNQPGLTWCFTDSLCLGYYWFKIT